jgi:flagellar hook-associated protein 3 FlgL
MLNTLTDLIESLNTSETQTEDLNELVQSSIFSFDNAMQSVSAGRSEVGGRLNVVSNVNLANIDQQINLKEAKAKISEVDFAEAISDLQRHETALQAANQTFGKVTGLTLFNFI